MPLTFSEVPGLSRVLQFLPKTKWHSLFPAVSRTIQVHPGLAEPSIRNRNRNPEPEYEKPDRRGRHLLLRLSRAMKLSTAAVFTPKEVRQLGTRHLISSCPPAAEVSA